MNSAFITSGFPLQDLIIGASIYFPPLFKAIFIGFFFWLIIHRLLREWLYSGHIQNPTLMDLALFSLSVYLSLLLLMVF